MMKNLIFILTLTAVCLMIALQAASAQAIVAAADSSHGEPSHYSPQFDSNSRIAQNLDRFSEFRNPNSDCIAFLSDSTLPKVKIFVPDPTLTDSMPIFEPGLVDPGIFIPGGECFDPNRNN